MLNVVVATDLSEGSGLAADAVCTAGAGVFAQVTLAHVVDLDPYTAGGSIPGIMEFARERLGEEAEHLRDAGIAAEVEVAQGDVVEMLEWLTIDRQADFVITTNLGEGAATGRLLGSTVEQLVWRGTVPVLVERVHVVETGACMLAADRTTFARTLVGAGSADSLPALLGAVSRLPGLESIRIVHALEGRPNDEARLQALQEAASAADLPGGTEVAVVAGEPGPAIVSEAAEWGATVIAMASRRRSVTHRMLRQSAVHVVTRDAHCAVLVIPASRDAAE